MLILVSCSKDEVVTTGSIVGAVQDSRNGALLSGVSVSLNPSGKSIVTGDDGRFEFTDLEALSYEVLFKKNNYQENHRSVTVRPGEVSSLSVQMTPATPKLEVSHSSLNFGDNTTEMGINIMNTGHALLTWTIESDNNWLSFSDTSGKIQENGTYAVNVKVNRDHLKKGSYTGVFSVRSVGEVSLDGEGIKHISVTVEVKDLSISISQPRLEFGYTEKEMMLTLKNGGHTAEKYEINTSDSWIVINELNGEVPANGEKNIKVAVNRTNLTTDDEGYITVKVAGYELKTIVSVKIPSTTVPSVQLYQPTKVDYSSAEFKATIASVGASKVFRHGFCWSKSENPVIDNNPSKCDYGECATPYELPPYKAEGLEMSTVYYVRAYAENNEGISYSNQVQFKTLGVPYEPKVSTGDVSNIKAYQADFSGTITDKGNVELVSAYGHVWNTEGNPTIDDYRNNKGETRAMGPYVSTLENLYPNTKYYVRAYATNERGTSYGEEKSFTTDYADVSLSTVPASKITSKTAVVGGRINSNGGHSIVERGVCWGIASTPTLSDNVEKASSQENEYKVTISGLSETTTYYARSYVKTAHESRIYYGETVSFQTTSKDVDITIEGNDNEETDWNK